MEMIETLLGLHDKELNWYQMSLRAVVVFIVASIYIRLAGMRAFRKRSPIDLVAALILGSILSKAVIGEEPFVPILVSSLVFVVMHKVSDLLIYWYRSHKKNPVYPVSLMKDGKIQEEEMRSMKITLEDLKEAARQGSVDDLRNVKCIYLESDGRISIIPC